MKYRTLHIAILLLFSLTASGQLQPLLEQYALNGLAINPAYAGSQDALSLGIYNRNQWVGFEGAPKTFTFSAHTPLRDKKVGLGIMVVADRHGTKSETGLIANYAYRIELKKGMLALGIAAGFSNLSTNTELIRYTDPGDNLILNPGVHALLPEFSFGAYYNSEKFFAGFSMPLMLDHTFNETSGKYKIGMHPKHSNYMLLAGYLFRASNDIELMPSILFKTNPGNDTQADLNINMIFREKFWVGTSIRTNKNMAFMVQFQANSQLRIAYSYAYEFSELSTYQKGSHEVMLLYNFRYILDVISPRYF
ncbi:MAG: type IX secretion system membrane protein PorP/SprF [Bacteroidales bacterium]|nr:type IX secretion system membrane protein PorP/SprF [Bacteroidales bacterium]